MPILKRNYDTRRIKSSLVSDANHSKATEKKSHFICLGDQKFNLNLWKISKLFHWSLLALGNGCWKLIFFVTQSQYYFFLYGTWEHNFFVVVLTSLKQKKLFRKSWLAQCDGYCKMNGFVLNIIQVNVLKTCRFPELNCCSVVLKYITWWHSLEAAESLWVHPPVCSRW